MSRGKIYAFLSVLLLITTSAFADWRETFAGMQNIAMDVRDARLGYGDITASTMTAEFILRSLQPQHSPQLYFIVDGTSDVKLRNVLSHNPFLSEQSHIIAFDRDRAAAPEAARIPTDVNFDLYMHLARRLADYVSPTDFRIPNSPHGIIRDNQLLMAEHGIRLILPVFSSGEAMRRAQQAGNGSYATSTANIFGFIDIGGSRVRLVNPGLGTNELGVYPDPTAIEVSQLSLEERFRRFRTALESRDQISNSLVRSNFTRLMNPSEPDVLRGAQRSVMSGITLDTSERNYNLYLSRLLDMTSSFVPPAVSNSHVFVTTEYFPEIPIGHDLRQRLVRLNMESDLPTQADPGKIYVVESPRLSQESFVTLLSLTNGQSVISGDGTLSAGAILRLDMNMVIVNWNESVFSGLQSYRTERAEGRNVMHFGDQLLPLLARARELSMQDGVSPLQVRLQLGREYSRYVIPDFFDSLSGWAEGAINFCGGFFNR